jgi:hypothetical protein
VLGGSPGSLRNDIPVPLPRPRGLDLEVSAEFREIEAQVRADMAPRIEKS